MSSFRIPGYGENRDGGATGLMIYGLHHDLNSSDSSDSDYTPSRINFDEDLESEDSNDLNERVDLKGKKRKKRMTRPVRKGRKKNDRTSQQDSEDEISSSSDENEKVVRSSRSGSIVTRDVERKRLQRESSFPSHSTPPCIETWASLPAEILSHIFSNVLTMDAFGVRYLCRCLQVCRSWCNVASLSVGWQGSADFSFLGGKDVATDDLLVRLASTRFAELKSLNLRGWRLLTDAGISSVAEHCTKLQALDISNCQKKLAKISMDNFVALAENTELRRVNFSNLRLTNTSKYLVSFIEIRGHDLTHFYCSDNVSTGSVVMTAIVEHCPNLQVLDLSNTSVRSVCFLNFQRKCPKLKELYMTNLTIEQKTIPNNIQETTGFPELKVLSVAKHNVLSWFTDNLVQVVLKTSSKLTMLDIRGNRSITHVGLDICSHSIEHLFMSHTNISSHIAELIARKWCRTLWDLDLSWSDAYGIPFDYLIDVLVTGESACTNLRRVNLAGTACSDGGVETLLAACTRLESLDLSSCRGISRGQKRFHDCRDSIDTLRRFYNVIIESNDDET